MFISKTKFKEYSKCQRFFHLEKLHNKKLEYNLNLDEDIYEVLGRMFSIDDGEELVNLDSDISKEMLDIYKQVEEEALKTASRVLNKEFAYYENTKEQKHFKFIDESGIGFECYLDGYNESNLEASVVEVKSTTSKKFLDLNIKKTPLFINQNNILVINPNLVNQITNYSSASIKNLYNRYSDVGRYIFDLAIERYIIEHSIASGNTNSNIKSYKYYLAVLNSNCVVTTYDANNQAIYSEDLITLIDLTLITKHWLEIIESYKNQIIRFIKDKSLEKPLLDTKCQINKEDKCPFLYVCFPELKESGNIYQLMNTREVEDNVGNKHSKQDLFNNNIKYIWNLPDHWDLSKINIIQKQAFDKEYINKEKIKEKLAELKYPLYHLDFESFNSPIPRFIGEAPYTQSVFQFSIHIERAPGICDYKNDNYSFLASDYLDNRKQLTKKLIEVIDLSKGGTVIAHNANFEKSIMNNLKKYFPEYGEKLDLIIDSLVDTMDIIRGDRKDVNYYHKDFQGSYSLKKLLPVLANLSYDKLVIKNGSEAIIEYAKFKNLSKEEIDDIKEELIKYCSLDTWAMVEILRSIRNKV